MEHHHLFIHYYTGSHMLVYQNMFAQNEIIFDKRKYFITHGYLYKKTQILGSLKKRFFALACDGNLYQFNDNNNVKNENYSFIYETKYDDMLNKLKKINILDFINKPVMMENKKSGTFTISSFVRKLRSCFTRHQLTLKNIFKCVKIFNH